MNENKPILFDAGVFIGALLQGDRRHQEARLIVETARRGEILACTTIDVINSQSNKESDDR